MKNIPFNIPPATGREPEYLAKAIANHKLCGDGPFTKQCHQWLEERTGASPSPEEEVLRRERRETLRRALNALDQRDRLLFYRKYYYCQSTAQIARELGLTERAVEGRLYRIKARLRQRMGGERP